MEGLRQRARQRPSRQGLRMNPCRMNTITLRGLGDLRRSWESHSRRSRLQAVGLNNRLEPDAADHWVRLQSLSRHEANGAFGVSLPPLRHLSFPAPTVVTDPARQASVSFEGQPCQVLTSADSACAFVRYPTARGAILT
jgi:hypothetical protein